MKLSKILAVIASVGVATCLFASCKSVPEQEETGNPINNEFTPGENETPLQAIE